MHNKNYLHCTLKDSWVLNWCKLIIMGNCYPESSEQRAQKLLLENELKLTMEFRKTIEDIYFKNIK